jgi:uncharacterized protein YndB with AHSA1/START domain
VSGAERQEVIMGEWTHKVVQTLPAPPAAVFRAWTEPARLERWFAEHADVQLHPGGAYRFWGRYTYDVPDGVRAVQRLVRFEAGACLEFEWLFGGVASVVTVTLRSALTASAGAGGTELTLEHRFAGEPPGPRGAELVDDWWRMVCGNLDAYLRGGDGIVRPDFTDAAPRVELSIVIDAPREQVFAALIEPEVLNQWIATAATVEPRAGGVYRYGWNYAVGERQVTGGPTEILEIVPNERLVTDWPDWRGDPDQPKTTVTWLVESIGDRTRLTLIHSGFARVADLADYPHGWGAFLDKLRRCLAQGH